MFQRNSSSWWQKLNTYLKGRPSPISRIPPSVTPSPYASTTTNQPLHAPRVLNGPFEESDLVLVQNRAANKPPKLTRPLTPGSVINVAHGNIPHERIIGALPGSLISSTLNTSYRVLEPSLDEYVRYSRRIVTPIYPSDAALIVSKLDIHPSPLPPSPKPQFEILEAGTGHGSLTLYLARAIAGFNPPVPVPSSSLSSSTSSSPSPLSTPPSSPADHSSAYSSWLASRPAVIHTIEVSPKHSSHARKTITAFRRGLYLPHIDFHTGSVSAFASTYYQANGARLAHAFLDLPGPETHIPTVAKAVRPGGKVIVFTPSVTGMLECLRVIKEEAVELRLESTVELGNNGGSGGREWDLRSVRIGGKKEKKEGKLERAREEGGEADEGVGEVGMEAEDGAGREFREGEERVEEERVAETAESQTGKELKWVCRPKVGDRINGGGFLGIFVKHGPWIE
ncbi:S-adenosyl-L-methionine-dependent methyltransferase [Myriangium duriaei CBS 260.36]|uniref:tRNA (adenine(58)-N(1))-methyltransferase catalytic subunit TRM61 n=1 Tax=Myriangium duriaei CBS 260.36 TaxID=1168546 RepID=A0A9P4J9D7_9PEZI|nr:S-adenosyl-L-methionine-dependent methyltransferase [Myriangium duriaei CBS 260.36]